MARKDKEYAELFYDLITEADMDLGFRFEMQNTIFPILYSAFHLGSIVLDSHFPRHCGSDIHLTLLP